MNKTKIDWSDFTWNPIVGCKHGCDYCYAKQINNRYKFIENWENPQFFEQRLTEIVPKLPKERNRIAKEISPNRPIVFVGSMCDIFGIWVKTEWIERIINYTVLYPNALFMFLTKNPQRALLFKFPMNCYIGTSIETSDKRKRLEPFDAKTGNFFVSIEPILGKMQSLDFSAFDFVIVGAMTGIKPIIPPIEFVKSIKHERIYFKDNILCHYPELSNYKA